MVSSVMAQASRIGFAFLDLNMVKICIDLWIFYLAVRTSLIKLQFDIAD
jgi:hypothetical protein